MVNQVSTSNSFPIVNGSDSPHQTKDALSYVITGIAIVALGFFAAFIQHPFSLGLGFIGVGLIAKGIKEYYKTEEQLVTTLETEKVPEAEKIPELEKMIGKIVGKASVLGKQDHLPHDVTITESCGWHDDEPIFNVYTDEDGKTKKIGYISLVWFRQMEDGRYGSKNYGQLSDGCYPNIYYGSTRLQEGKNLSKICIQDMRSLNKDKYQGVGTLLYQVAIEHGYKVGCEGRLILDAVWNSHGFHYKLGSRSQYPEPNNKIAEELNKAKEEGRDPDTTELGAVWMYMPQEAICKWKKKIEEHPILFNLDKI